MISYISWHASCTYRSTAAVENLDIIDLDIFPLGNIGSGLDYVAYIYYIYDGLAKIRASLWQLLFY